MDLNEPGSVPSQLFMAHAGTPPSAHMPAPYIMVSDPAPVLAPQDHTMADRGVNEGAKFGAKVAKESARNEKIAKKSLKAKSRAYAYAPKEPMCTHCHDLGVTS
ncbi:hypothetical protein PIB30_049282 [Stylosanthes scabra]|uniref:Uncharacterized protein n=1 Tax=Stylosanthes scabra TaxID=79078 RepID=A0ABU6YGL3_9FABA|nr:hypothetical protein [Stylosanthes scabra]